MNRRRNLLFAVLSLSVLLTACGNKGEQAVHFSDEGLIPEAYLPADLGMVVSYSTRDPEQFKAIQTIEQKLGDSDRVSRTASETLDTQLGDVGLDFERDLQPAFGDQFHMVYGVRPTEGDEPENFAVITLTDPGKMESVLKTLVENEQISEKKLSNIEAYVKEDSNIFLTVYKDLLFMTTSGENLVAMTEQDEDESLWKSDLYEETLSEVGSDYLLYGVMYPSTYSGDLSLPAGFSVSDIPSVVDKQVVVVRAEEEGLSFDAWVNANKEKAKEAEIAFDVVPRSEPYLFEEIPAEGLMVYFESYGLAQTFAQARTLGDDTQTVEQLEQFTQNYFGMDFEDLMSFLDKGYALTVHDNGNAVIPGITLYVDASSNAEQAEDFVSKLDGQLSGLMMIAEQVLPGAIVKDTVKWGEEDFSHIKLDLTSLPQSEESPLPSALTSNSLELVYGVKDERLIISTLSNWGEGESVADSELYKALSGKTTDEDEGLILLDANGIAKFVSTVRSLQEQLGPTDTQSTLDVEEFLDGFLGAIAQSKTGKYESHFSGFLMLAD